MYYFLRAGIISGLIYAAPMQAETISQSIPVPSDSIVASDTEYSDTTESARDSNQDRDSIIDDLRARIEALEQRLQQNDAESAGARLSTQSTDASRLQQIEQERAENLSLIESAFNRTLVEEGGLLLPPGKLNYVATLTYTHSSSDRIVVDGFSIEDILVVGDIVSRQVRRDQQVLNNVFRLGLKHDMQVDVQIPVGHERLQSYSSSGEETSERNSALGDISVSLGYQLVKSSPLWPDTLVNLNWKSTSGEDPYGLASHEELALGSGFRSWGLSLTTVNISDPVVFYAGIAWRDNLGRQKNIGDVDPGDSYGLHLGMVFALNLDTSMSYGFQLNNTDKTSINGQKIPGSNLVTSLFTLGVSNILDEQYSFDVTLGIGLTRDSPDVQLSLSFPYSFP